MEPIKQALVCLAEFVTLLLLVVLSVYGIPLVDDLIRQG